jgi:division protein CdvB (Snf7/Vps24/ESCRT-III family)
LQQQLKESIERMQSLEAKLTEAQAKSQEQLSNIEIL